MYGVQPSSLAGSARPTCVKDAAVADVAKAKINIAATAKKPIFKVKRFIVVSIVCKNIDKKTPSFPVAVACSNVVHNFV